MGSKRPCAASVIPAPDHTPPDESASRSMMLGIKHINPGSIMFTGVGLSSTVMVIVSVSVLRQRSVTVTI